MRLLALLMTMLAAGLLVGGCARGGDDDERATPAQTTPEEIRLAIFERSYSECASYGVERLALKHRVEPTPNQVAAAVARSWKDRFQGRADALASGRNGCLQGLRDR